VALEQLHIFDLAVLRPDAGSDVLMHVDIAQPREFFRPAERFINRERSGPKVPPIRA